MMNFRSAIILSAFCSVAFARYAQFFDARDARDARDGLEVSNEIEFKSRIFFVLFLTFSLMRICSPECRPWPVCQTCPIQAKCLVEVSMTADQKYARYLKSAGKVSLFNIAGEAT